MRVWYNELDPKAAAWLRQLMADGLIPKGDVDERSIADVGPDDVRGYDQCHFFAGIGGWAYALELAGWGERPIWTGSCPCQPYSAAGKGGGHTDARDLWPAWFRLIRECRPDTIAGEQVTGAIGHGWLDRLSADLEGEGYAVGAAVLGAHSVGAPHIRQRLYWVADAEHAERWSDESEERGGTRGETTPSRGLQPSRRLGNSPGSGRAGGDGTSEPEQGSRSGREGNPWSDLEWLPCRDGKYRTTQPGIFPLAHGVSGRVGLLRGAGNAIVAPLAAEFLQAYQEARCLT